MNREIDRLKYPSYTQAKKWVQKNKISNRQDYYLKKPKHFPYNPHDVYKNKGWIDNRNFFVDRFVSYEECKKWARDQKITKMNNFFKAKKPKTIPTNLALHYKNKGWLSWSDFFDRRNKRDTRGLKNLKQCKKWARDKKIKTKEQFDKRKKSIGIPSNPDYRYKNKGWISWGDFLGTGPTNQEINRKNNKKIQRILTDLQKNWKFYSRWTDGLIRDWFDREGLFTIKDPYIRSFFTNFIDLRNSVEGRKALLNWLKTKRFSETGKNIFMNKTEILEIIKPINMIRTKQKSRSLESGYAILKVIEDIDIVVTDSSTLQNHISYTIQLLWKSIFDPKKEKREVKLIKKMKKNGNKFHDSVLIRFLNQYNQVREIKLSKNYIGKYTPTLMQLYTAYRMKKSLGFFNISNVGVGKTLSAIISSLVCRSNYTLIICPNNIVNQWKEILEECVKDCIVSTGKYPHKKINRTHNYHIINYDKFSQGYSKQVIRNIYAENYDFIILDETQNIKIRNISQISKRRILIETLLNKIRKKSAKVKTLCLSATPIINNVKEGVSLLEMVTGSKHSRIDNDNTVRSASQLHTEFLLYSLRYSEKFKIKEIGGLKSPIVVEGYVPNDISVEELEKTSFLGFEQYLLQSKIEQVKKLINGKTIIYTEYVTGIVTKLQKELEKNGYKVGLFIGSDKSGKDLFLDNKIDVLIASSPISEGVDELQNICSNLIFLTLPFTHSRFEQVKGRIIRKNQKKKQVRIHVLNGVLNGYQYDQKIKLNRIDFKNKIGECVTEGILPKKIQIPGSNLRKKIIETIIRNRDSGILTRKQARMIIN